MTTGGSLGRVMLIDDAEVDQMMCRRILTRSKMATDIIGFTCAETALAYLADPQKPPVDLILLDINMPRMNGFEFLDAAERTYGPGTGPPVMIMLGAPMTEAAHQHAARFPRIRAYCEKPLGSEHLRQAAGLLSISAPRVCVRHEVPALAQ